ncbi:MAG: Xaa-Pro peptidase family protein [Actinobacteria bacterium]|nr:Xaa-Pro peptidase family protein [Actinomycetota bacterium]
MMKITYNEFTERVIKVKEILGKKNLDMCIIFGDEYRKEYLRYVSDFWPIFEKSSLFIFHENEPVLGVSAECENYAKESSIWKTIRNIDGFGCVTVPEKIDFPYAKIYSFKKIFEDFVKKPIYKRIGIVGLDLVTVPLFNIFKSSFDKFEILNITEDFNKLRLIKSENEINCLRESFRIADRAYIEMIKSSKPGVSELEIAAIGEYTARKSGAEFIPFCNVTSGERSNTVIGRATSKVVNEGDIISAALAVQYNGYISTVQFPYVVGNKISKEQKKLFSVLIEAENRGLKHLKNGITASNFVKAVRNYFRENNLEEFDIYPPLHGIGVAEAESPYPNERSNYTFKSGMTVNVDISLFKTSTYSNRIEEGFVVADDGYKPFSKLVRKMSEYFIETGKIAKNDILDSFID